MKRHLHLRNRLLDQGYTDEAVSVVSLTSSSGGYINGRNSANLELLIDKTSSIYLYVKLKSLAFQWCISLGIIFDLAGEKCNHGDFGLRKDSSFSSYGYFWKCSDNKC
jgi:hypothetical protein